VLPWFLSDLHIQFRNADRVHSLSLPDPAGARALGTSLSLVWVWGNSPLGTSPPRSPLRPAEALNRRNRSVAEISSVPWCSPVSGAALLSSGLHSRVWPCAYRDVRIPTTLRAFSCRRGRTHPTAPLTHLIGPRCTVLYGDNEVPPLPLPAPPGGCCR